MHRIPDAQPLLIKLKDSLTVHECLLKIPYCYLGCRYSSILCKQAAVPRSRPSVTSKVPEKIHDSHQESNSNKTEEMVKKCFLFFYLASKANY